MKRPGGAQGQRRVCGASGLLVTADSGDGGERALGTAVPEPEGGGGDSGPPAL